MTHRSATRRDILAAAMTLSVAASAWPGRPAHALRLADLGPAPEFAGISAWLGSPPLTMAGLRGQVVLIDFWTHTCSNWLRTLPYLNRWHDAYHDKGLVIVGVHTPEFSFEHQRAGVEDAIKRYRIAYPVAQDNDFATWRAWRNQYWPAQMLVDRSGRVVLRHYGEGDYAGLENAVRQLTGASGPAVAEPDPDLSGIGSPEMYFGLARQEYLAAAERPHAGRRAFSLPARLPLNRFGLGGNWTLANEDASLSEGAGEIAVRFRAAKVHLVAASDAPTTLGITVDGRNQPAATIHDGRLYTLFDGGASAERVIRLSIPGPGLRAYTFTFG
jgi:thiol-disulfide isomerase/thioredoxin